MGFAVEFQSISLIVSAPLEAGFEIPGTVARLQVNVVPTVALEDP